jgi:hypothetical protein
MATKIQIRRDTAANWTSNDPVLSLGEQGFETDTNKVKIGDGVAAWSALAYVSGGSSKLEVQDPTVDNEYYIYVGAPANALSPIANLNNTQTNYEYDQSFATAQEAFNFIMANDWAAPAMYEGEGMSTPKIVVAFEENVVHAMNATLILQDVQETVQIVSQNAVNPLGYQSASQATFGTSASELVFWNCNWVGIGGDLIFECNVKVEQGSHVYDAESNEWNDYTLYNAALSVQNDSTMNHSNHGFIGTTLTVRQNSFYKAADIEASTSVIVERSSKLFCSTYTKAPLFRVGESTLNTSTLEITTGSTGTSLFDAGSDVFCRSTFTDSGSPGASCFVSEGTTMSASSFVFTAPVEIFVNGALYNSTYFASINAGFCAFGDVVFKSRSNTGFAAPLMPTADPVDGGRTFYLNNGVMTLSS